MKSILTTFLAVVLFACANETGNPTAKPHQLDNTDNDDTVIKMAPPTGIAVDSFTKNSIQPQKQ
jgi:hypothetical protein